MTVEDAQIRVLVVDDDEAIRTLVTRLFERRGYAVSSASDGAEAIEQLDNGTFDLMMLDLMMPRVDGIGVVEHVVASDRPRPKIIVMSAAAPNIVSRLRAEHVAKIVTKPFDLEQLMRHADEALASRSETAKPA
jgi:CheY-like chemotaxis protein